jgi:EAL domain-containing protein (putative c-di-GMP-specific phosphodiesterase class I)
MHYNISYQVTSLFFLVFILVLHGQGRRFPGIAYRMFASVLRLTFASVLLDVITAKTIEYVLALPFWINYILNSIFYSIQTTLPMVLYLFVLALAGAYHRHKRAKRLWLMAIPTILGLAHIMINPFCRTLFYIDKNTGYNYGSLFGTLYANAGIYMAAIFFVIIRYRKVLGKTFCHTIYLSLVGISAALMIQINMPHLLVIGLGLSLVVAGMYYILQNPRDIIDLESGAFSQTAFNLFLPECEMSRRPTNFLLVEITNFSQIERYAGSLAKRDLLADISRTLACVSKRVIVFRVAHAHFAAFCRNGRDFQNLKDVVSFRLQTGWDGGLIPQPEFVACSFEAVSCADATSHLPAFLAVAFTQAAKAGPDRSMLAADEQFLAGIERKIAIDAALHSALHENTGWLRFDLQPVYSVSDKKITAAEALMRFSHPKLGCINPTEIMEIAEQNAATRLLDLYMTDLVCSFIKSSRLRERFGVGRVSVNLSAQSFADKNFGRYLLNVIEQNEADPSDIIFEITETAFIAFPDTFVECLKQLKKRGLLFALDDFGTGFANITSVVDLPFDIVKISRGMLMKTPQLFEQLVPMLNEMGLTVVAEGAETREQVEMLADKFGVNFIQGYYFAKPMPPAEFINFLQTRDEPLL